MAMHLLDKEEVIIHGNNEKTRIEKNDIDNNNIINNIGNNVYKDKIKKKPEKPVRILRIRYYEKISLSFMNDDRLEKKDAFAVNRGLEDLLKALGCNTDIKGTTTSCDCIIVEKNERMGIRNKFIFLDIGTNDFYTLKKQMENYTTICAFNQGEFMILDGKMSSLSEMYDIPKVWRENKNINRDILDSNDSHNDDDDSIIEVLRDELKNKFKAYHYYDDERIDKMKDQELVDLKRFVNRKIEIENRNRKFYKDLLK